jgi:acetoin utilization protein AcuC
VAPVAATRAEIQVFHEREYLDALVRAGGGDLDADGFARGLGTPDCPVFKGMYEYSALAAGATLVSARLIMDGRADVAFNPSGGYHHAGPGYASGFCYVNDVVLAAMELRRKYDRILFIDLDVHHCDGVQNAFYSRRDVMTVSMHESGKTLFPGTGFENEIGDGEGRGYSVNIPLPVGTYDAAYLAAFDAVVLPVAKAFNPGVIVVELGMDTLSGDPLAHLHLTNNVHMDILQRILGLGKPVVATGGGGYNVDNTVRAWALLWGVMTEEPLDDISAGMGGVMLGNREWLGGLRDRMLLSDAGRRATIDAEVAASVDKVKGLVFPILGIR